MYNFELGERTIWVVNSILSTYASTVASITIHMYSKGVLKQVEGGNLKLINSVIDHSKSAIYLP